MAVGLPAVTNPPNDYAIFFQIKQGPVIIDAEPIPLFFAREAFYITLQINLESLQFSKHSS